MKKYLNRPLDKKKKQCWIYIDDLNQLSYQLNHILSGVPLVLREKLKINECDLVHYMVTVINDNLNVLDVKNIKVILK